MKNAPWNFPDLPPFLAGLTLEHVSKLQALILRHGMFIGVARLGDAHTMMVREPAPMNLIIIGPPETADLLVLEAGESQAELATIQLPGPDLRGRVVWNPRVTFEAVLAVLEAADTVIKTSQLAKSGKDGLN